MNDVFEKKIQMTRMKCVMLKRRFVEILFTIFICQNTDEQRGS